jgi:putative glutamine amidotransferase
VVVLTATTRLVDGVERVRLNAAYVRALEAEGLVPVVVPPSADPRAATRVLDSAAGLVLTGGEDVDPAEYAESPHPELGPVNRARDATELALLASARDRGVPTLAICRGIQVVNVALGGTLVQDLPSQRPGTASHERDDRRDARVHDVLVEPGSRLAAALGAHALAVNSMHHQALDRVSGSVRVSARAPDGVIEGIESVDERWWMLGVQWHPEELTATPEPWDRRLFAAFADACRRGVSSASTSLPSAPGASASRASGGAGT